MNLKISNPLVYIPAAAISCGWGAAVSSLLFIKLSHILEYTLHKTFGDYNNPKKTCFGRVVVQMTSERYFLRGRFFLAVLLGVVSSKAFQVLGLYGCPKVIALPCLIGAVVAPIFICLQDIILRSAGAWSGNRVAVAISDAEISNYGINKDRLEEMNDLWVYHAFGEKPILSTTFVPVDW